jgi:hypothetical protein
MYPHERSLVERMKGRPFVLIGVNSDAKERAKQAVEENQLSWRSFWDGASTHGPITTQWNVTGWPTVYVLDHKGVIRCKGVRGEGLDKAIDLLVAEAEARGKDQ